jgi:cytidylate kinase
VTSGGGPDRLGSGRRPVVTIDGPAGSGKSTLARGLAASLELPYVNTGLMYRALTRLALDRGVDVDDGVGLARLMGEMQFDLSEGSPAELRVNGRVPGAELSTPGVEAAISAVSRHPEVRLLMRHAQRRLGRGGAVVEGRDIGSVVFPDADAKIFLQAHPDERAARRTEERRASEGASPGPAPPPTDVAEVASALARRDALDARVNPFVPAPDAMLLDTSGRSAEEVFAEARDWVAARIGEVSR